MRYLLLFLAAPGSFALLAIALRELVRTVRNVRQDNEDAERALRIQKEYMVPDWAVLEAPEPMGKRRVSEPEDVENFQCPVCKSCGELGCGCCGDCDPKAAGCRYGEAIAQQKREEAISLAEWEAQQQPEKPADLPEIRSDHRGFRDEFDRGRTT